MATKKEQIEFLTESLRRANAHTCDQEHDIDALEDELKDERTSKEFFEDLSKRYLKIIENFSEVK